MALWLQKFGVEEFLAKLLGLRGRQRREAKEDEQWIREKGGRGRDRESTERHTDEQRQREESQQRTRDRQGTKMLQHVLSFLEEMKSAEGAFHSFTQQALTKARPLPVTVVGQLG